MAQNTALQELIEQLKEKQKTCNLVAGAGIERAIRFATELLPKERKDIEEAHDKGISRYCQWEPDKHGNEAPTGSDYFTNTFNQ